MIAFKGFTKDLAATLGQGTFYFEQGKTYREGRSKCASGGFHCAEYPFDCFSYYHLNGENRFFMVEAGGSIDEDGNGSRIACTELTVLEELDVHKLAYHGMKYMIMHPRRDWKYSGTNVCVEKEEAALGKYTGVQGAVVIARGSRPAAKGPAGCALGLLAEPEPGVFSAARLVTIDGNRWRPDTWYTVDEKGMIVEAGKR